MDEIPIAEHPIDRFRDVVGEQVVRRLAETFDLDRSGARPTRRGGFRMLSYATKALHLPTFA